MSGLRTALVNHSDINGGAARAAYRLHQALRSYGVDSRMYVNNALSGDWTVDGPTTKWSNGLAKLRPHLGKLATALLKTGNPVLHSPALVPSRWVKRLNQSDADMIHLHWVNDEMMSVTDIGNLHKPVAWTLHDMWAFCGAEHYTEEHRWREGYTQANRPVYESGFDLNRWTWQRKLRNWHRPMHIITPSQWLADCVRESALMRDWPVSTVANCIDTVAWQPIDKALARRLFHLPPDVPLVLFGALGGANDPRKGFDLLKAALNQLQGQLIGLELAVFGQPAPNTPSNLGLPVHYTGHLHDDISLRILYCAADALVIPSRQDNLPNAGLESLACGTPIVAFNTCGLPDIIVHQKTGYLAKAFDPGDLASGILWVLADRVRYTELCVNARADAVNRFSYQVIAEQYLNVYETILGKTIVVPPEKYRSLL